MCDFPSSIHHSFSLLPASVNTLERDVQVRNASPIDGGFSLVHPEATALDSRLITVPTAATLLVQAIENRDIVAFKTLIQDEDLDPNAPNDHGVRPLTAALEQEHYEMIRLLLRHPKMNVCALEPSAYQLARANPQLRPLFLNFFNPHFLEAIRNTSPDLPDLRSIYRLSQMSSLFQLPECYVKAKNNILLNWICGITGEKQDPCFAGASNPDHVWAALEKAWENVRDQAPQYMKDAIEDLIQTIHTGDMHNIQKIKDRIDGNRPVSFLLHLPKHMISISICEDVGIITNFGGVLNLSSGECAASTFNPLTGKRIIQLSPEHKACLTPDCIASLQLGDQSAIKCIFEIPVIGFIQYKGQKRGNCAGTHPKSIWEDQLLFAQIRDMHQQKGIAIAFHQLFVDHPEIIIQHSKLVQSSLKPALRIFKTLTLKVREQTKQDFEKDENIAQFLSRQLELNAVDENTRKRPHQVGLEMVKSIQTTALESLNTKRYQLWKSTKNIRPRFD